MGTAWATRAGTSLYYEDLGSGPPVLCLHGIGGGAWFFSGFARRLADRHRVLCVDLPGSGRSPSGPAGSPPVTLDRIVADLEDLVRDVVREPVILLGHSFGAILALRAWQTWPAGSIRALIFACGLPRVRPPIRERLAPRAEAIARDGVAGWGPKVSPGVFSRKSMEERPEVVAMFERLFEEQEPQSYVRAIELLLAADLEAAAPTVTVPCTAVAGADDSYAPPDAARAFAAALPRPCPVTVLEGCAHMPFLEDPEAFAGAVGPFLSTV